MKENKLEKVLVSIAYATCNSTSCIGLYEPKVPKKLVEKESKKR